MPNNVIKDKSELAIARILIALCVVLRPDAYNIFCRQRNKDLFCAKRYANVCDTKSK